MNTTKKANLELAQNPEKLQASLVRVPELSEWQMPSDEDLWELVRLDEVHFESESGLAAGGHKYTVLDEPTCVTATIEIYSVGHIAKSVGSSWQAAGANYGLKISEEVFND